MAEDRKPAEKPEKSTTDELSDEQLEGTAGGRVWGDPHVSPGEPSGDSFQTDWDFINSRVSGNLPDRKP